MTHAICEKYLTRLVCNTDHRVNGVQSVDTTGLNNGKEYSENLVLMTIFVDNWHRYAVQLHIYHPSLPTLLFLLFFNRLVLFSNYRCNNIAAHKHNLTNLMSNISQESFHNNTTNGSLQMMSIDNAPFDNMFYLHIFTLLTASVLLFGLFRAVHSFHMFVTAAAVIHRMMLDAILRCSMSFFNTNPVGKFLPHIIIFRNDYICLQ